MVNPGHASEGCIRCKDRRVKCDTVKPSCGNCIKLGTPCPGYPERPKHQFRDDTAKTQARAKRIYRNLQTRTEEQGPSSSGSSPTTSVRGSPNEQKLRLVDSEMKAAYDDPGFDDTSSIEVGAGYVAAFAHHLNRRGFAAYVDRMYDAVALYRTATGPLKSAVELLAFCASADATTIGQHKSRVMFDKMRSKVWADMYEALEQLRNGSGEHDQVLLAVEMTLIIDCVFDFRDASPEDIDKVISLHFQGMSAIVEHAGPALLETELGRHHYVHLFLYHLHFYSPSIDVAPLPGPCDAAEVLSQKYSHMMPEYRMLPTLCASFNMRREALQIFTHQSQHIDVQVLADIRRANGKIRHDLERMWARLPAARKFGGSSVCRWIVNAHWVHRILVEDTQVRCLRALQDLQGQVGVHEDEIATSIQKAQFAVHTICQSSPFSFSEADLPAPDEEPPTFQDVLYAWNGYNPLLICSMVDVLSEEQHMGILYARGACARAAGLQHPVKLSPRILLKVK